MSNKYMARMESSRREIEPAFADRTEASDRDGQSRVRGSKSLRSKTGLSSQPAPESQNEDATQEVSSTGQEPSAALDGRSVAVRIAELSTLGLPELRAEWRRLFRRDAPRLGRDLMTRMIAYRIQENVFGSLPPAIERRLAKMAGELESKGRITAPAPPKMKSGARLVREWHGRTHAVSVVDSGFEYGGRTFPSLSAIAFEITGAHWSGPRFFGLIRRKGARNGDEAGDVAGLKGAERAPDESAVATAGAEETADG